MSTATKENELTTAKGEKTKESKESKSPFASAVVGETGISVKSGAEMWALATAIARSGLAPKGVDTPEAILIALQMGYELGIPPMAALQNIAIINGRPSLWGDAVLAVVRSTGELEEFVEWYEQGTEQLPRNPVTYTDDTVAVCRVKRRGSEPVEVGFSVADAKRADLWTKSGPWKQYPFRMLRQRARSYALRDAFGDALRGMLSAEEAQDIPTVDAVSFSQSKADSSQATRSESLKTKMQSHVQRPANQTPEAAAKDEASEAAEETTEADPPARAEPYTESQLREMLSYASTADSLAEVKSHVMESLLPKPVKVDLCTEISDRLAVLEEEAANAN